MLRIVSFATPRYHEHLTRLEDSCIRHGLPHRLQYLQEEVGRRRACEMKPLFVRRNMPCLWIDADSYFTGPFELPGGEWDVGLIKGRGGATLEVAASVVAAQDTPAARRFVDCWVHAVRTPIDCTRPIDHHALMFVYHLSQKRELATVIDISGVFQGRYHENEHSKKRRVL